MRIQIVTLTRDFDARKKGRWHILPRIFREFGHEIDYLGYSNWFNFYAHYLFFNPDVIIVASINGFLPVFLKMLGLVRKPVVLDWVDNFTETIGKKWGIAIVAFLEYFTLSGANYITAPSRVLYKKALHFGKKAFLIEHGVDENFTKNDTPKKLAGRFKVIYAGDLSVKQIEHLISAVKDTKYDLYLIGENPPPNLPLNVHAMGFIPNDELFSYLLGADVLAITADQASCLKMYEYILAGKPIIAKKGEIGYFFDNGVNACLVDDLKSGLDKLYRDKTLREKLSKNVRKIKVKTWREVGRGYIDFLERICAKEI